MSYSIEDYNEDLKKLQRYSERKVFGVPVFPGFYVLKGIGSTAFSWQIAESLAEIAPVYYFSYFDTPVQLVSRSLARELLKDIISNQYPLTNNLTTKQILQNRSNIHLETLKETCSSKVVIYQSYPMTMTVSEIIKRIDALLGKSPIIFIDSLQACTDSPAEYPHIFRQLLHYSRKNNTTFIVVCEGNIPHTSVVDGIWSLTFSHSSTTLTVTNRAEKPYEVKFDYYPDNSLFLEKEVKSQNPYA